MRKGIAVKVLSGIVGFLFVVSGSGALAQKVELDYLSCFTYMREAITEIVDRFEAENPNVQVNLRLLEDQDYKLALRVAVGAGEVPDVFVAAPHMAFLYPYVDEGVVADLSEAYEEEGLNQVFPPFVLDWVTYTPRRGPFKGKEGKWVIATHVTNHGFWYYPDSLVKYGLGLEFPKDLDEFYTFGDKIKGQGGWPLVLGGRDFWPIYTWMNVMYPNVAGDELTREVLFGRARWDNPYFVTATEIMESFAKRGYFIPDPMGFSMHDAEVLFCSREAVTFLIGDWPMSMFRKLDPEGFKDLQISVGPSMVKGKPMKMAIEPGDAIAASALSKHKKEAIALAVAHAKLESVKTWIAVGGRISARLEANTPDLLSPVQKQILKILKSGPVTSATKDRLRGVQDVWARYMSEMFTGAISAKEVCEKTQKDSEKFWAEYRAAQ